MPTNKIKSIDDIETRSWNVGGKNLPRHLQVRPPKVPIPPSVEFGEFGTPPKLDRGRYTRQEKIRTAVKWIGSVAALATVGVLAIRYFSRGSMPSPTQEGPLDPPGMPNNILPLSSQDTELLNPQSQVDLFKRELGETMPLAGDQYLPVVQIIDSLQSPELLDLRSRLDLLDRELEKTMLHLPWPGEQCFSVETTG